MGCSFRAYRYYESGERTPPGDVLVALSKASGKSIDWILTGVEKADSVREVRGTYLTTEEKLIEIVHALSEKDRLDILEFAEFKQKKHLKED